MPEPKIPTFAELEEKRKKAEALLLESLSPEQQAAYSIISDSQAARLAAQKAVADEELIARITAQVLKQVGVRNSGPITEIGRPAMTVHHGRLRCDQTGETIAADHPNPVRYFREQGVTNPTFSGADTFIAQAERLAPHHAVFIRDDHSPDIEQRELPEIKAA